MTNRLLLILCFYCLNSFAIKAQEGNKLISLSVKNVRLKGILKEIEKQTDYSFVYNETFQLQIKKSLSLKNETLEHVLSIVFQNTDIGWTISGKHILLQKTTRKITISGYVTDSKSGETLIGASLGDCSKNTGGITNDYGYFTFRVPEGETKLEISYIGYKSDTLYLSLHRDTLIRVGLQQSAWLKEVVIESTKNKTFCPSTGSIELSVEDIKNTPTVFGETDIMKTLQLLPGIQSGAEGAAGLYVRGGGPDQNLTLLDGVNVYNTSHLLGLFSIFNGDAIKKVTLYKGSFPARFGGRLSSVIDTRMKDGDMQNYHGSFSIGLLSSRLNVEGPIIKGKTSFNVSARRSYIDGFLRVSNMLSGDAQPIIYFYDLNAKINHSFSDKSRLYLSLYNGKDKLGVDIENTSYIIENSSSLEKINYQWGNTIASLRWNYVFNNKLFSNTTIAYNNYKFNFETANKESQNSREGIPYVFQYSTYQYSGIRDWSANTDFEYLPDNNHRIRFGAGYIYHTFKPEIHGSKQFEKEGETIIKDVDHPFISENIIGQETSLYGEDEFSLTDRWKTNLGLHFSTFTANGKSYLSLQPRFSLGYELNRKLSFKTSYTEMSQYIHLLMSSALSQPTDLWVPVTPELTPMRARQATLGAFFDTRNGYNFSAEGFYKHMSNLLEYRDEAVWGENSTSWYEQVESGEGRACGVELFAQKTTGKLTGWVGYTLAWNDRKFPTINSGKRFPAKYDRRHDVKINLTYKPSQRIDFSVAWTYATGNNFTVQMEEYPTIPLDNLYPNYYTYNNFGNQTQWVEQYENRNNYRMKPIHHLDFSMNYYRKKSPKGRQAIWNLTIYNVYNQACPYLIYPGFNENKGKFVLKQISLFPILPSVSYTYKF